MKIKNIAGFILLVSLLTSCDCFRHIQGVVVDAETGLPIADSEVFIDYSSKDTLNNSKYKTYTDSTGVFEYTYMKSGICGCSKTKLLIKKQAYNDVVKKYKSYRANANKDTIYLFKK